MRAPPIHTGSVVILLPTTGFPGEAFLVLIEHLRRRGIEISIVAERPGPCLGTGGVRATAFHWWGDPELTTMAAGAFVVFDDADGSVAEAGPVRDLLYAARGQQRVVAGVGAGGNVLARAGLRPGGGVLIVPESRAGALADELDGFRGIYATSPVAPPID